MLLGFLSGEICQSMKVKPFNFLMLGGNHCLSTFVRERRKELEYAPWSNTRRFSLSILYIHGEIAVFLYECPFGNLSVCCVISWSSSWHPQQKAGAAWGSCSWVALVQIAVNKEVTFIFFIAITLMGYLLLTYVKRLFRKEAIFYLDA